MCLKKCTGKMDHLIFVLLLIKKFDFDFSKETFFFVFVITIVMNRKRIVYLHKRKTFSILSRLRDFTGLFFEYLLNQLCCNCTTQNVYGKKKTGKNHCTSKPMCFRIF